MSSWYLCECGQQIHKNLFAEAGVKLVIEDTVLDQFDDQKSASQLAEEIVRRSSVFIECAICGRIAIFRKNGETESYSKEK